MSTILKGIDVSKWQGVIDWDKVKADGVEFAMLRAGYGQSGVDEQFERNAQECTRLGIPFGVYWFSYAYTTALAEREAERCLAKIAPYNISYPVAFDWEYDSYDYAVERGIVPTKALVSDIARAFLNKIESAGYFASLYANPNYLAQFFEDDMPERYDIWLAKWPKNPQPEPKPNQAGGMWQYTSSGSVDGIYGRVDMNYAYYDYPALTGNIPEPVPDTPAAEPEEDIGGVDAGDEYVDEGARARDRLVVLGVTDGERPDEPATRGEVWVMLCRLMDIMEEM